MQKVDYVEITNLFDEESKYFIRLARQANNNIFEDTSHYSTQGVGAYAHDCPYRTISTPRSTRDYSEIEYWLSKIRGIVYNGVARNYGWTYCRKCNPKELTPEHARKEIAARIILRFFRNKIPILKFKQY
jgi:gamma-glutamyl-gamma-aminobutyrate hydrolase PuuD